MAVKGSRSDQRMGARAVAGKRASLRAIGDEDLAAIDTWYGEAAKAAYESRSSRETFAGDNDTLLAIVRPNDDQPIGLLEYETANGWVTVPFIALAKAYRGWGYGSEAVRLLEEWTVREGIADRFRAEVDVRNGLGLYFWLRLGYRPLGAAEEGRVLAMVREAG